MRVKKTHLKGALPPRERGKSSADRVICAKGVLHDGKFRLRCSPDSSSLDQLFQCPSARQLDCSTPRKVARGKRGDSFRLHNSRFNQRREATLRARTGHKAGARGALTVFGRGLPASRTKIRCPQVPVENAVRVSHRISVSKWQCGCYGNW